MKESLAAQEVFLKEMRSKADVRPLYFDFIHQVIENGNEIELGFLINELDRMVSALQSHAKPWTSPKPYAYKVKGDSPQISFSLRFDILKRDGYKCKLCGRTAEDGIKLHVDHKVAFSKGGKTLPDNLQALCEPCNLGKKAKDL